MNLYGIINEPLRAIKSYGIQFTHQELIEEEWKPLSDIPNNLYETLTDKQKYFLSHCRNSYFISNLGRFCRFEFNKYRLNSVIDDKDGYKKINIGYNYKHIAFRIHRLVAFIFVFNNDVQNKTMINHIDECKYNNRYTNLEWCTDIYNNKYGNRIKKCKESLKTSQKFKQSIESQKRKIKCINNITNEITYYDSIKEVSEILSISYAQIFQCCRGKDSYNGYSFEYNDNVKAKPRKITQFQPLVRLDLDFKNPKLYLSENEIKNDNINNLNRIFRLCKTHNIKNTICGYRWIYLIDYNKCAKQYNLKEFVVDVNIVMLSTRGLRFIKYYNSLDEIVKDNLGYSKIINSCEGITNCNKYCQKFMYLKDYLKLKNITSLDQLTDKDMYKPKPRKNKKESE